MSVTVISPLSEVIKEIQKMGIVGKLEELKGLFQTDKKVGRIFPIVKDEKGELQVQAVCCNNSPEGELTACEIMDDENFMEWALDPWTGEVNIEIV